MLQAGRWGVRLPTGSLIFSMHLILPAPPWLQGLISLSQKSDGLYRRVRPGRNTDVRSWILYRLAHNTVNIMKTKKVAILDKAKPDTGNTKGLSLAAVVCTTVQVSRLPLWRQLLVGSRA
jgi:hypothetical protein